MLDTLLIKIILKLDKLILETIREKFKISSRVQYKIKHNYHSLSTSNSRSIENVVTFFKNKLLGIKSLEFRIWSRTLKFKGDHSKMKRVQALLSNIENLRPM